MREEPMIYYLIVSALIGAAASAVTVFSGRDREDAMSVGASCFMVWPLFFVTAAVTLPFYGVAYLVERWLGESDGGEEFTEMGPPP